MLGYMLDEKRPNEVYRIEITEFGFAFKIKDALYKFFLESIQREEVLATFLAIQKTNDGEFAILSIVLPFIRFPNYTHKKTDWKKLSECAQQIRLLLSLLHAMPKDKSTPDLFLSDRLQLMTLQTAYNKDSHFHACGINVGFCKTTRELLAQKYKTRVNIKECEEIAFNFYFGLSSSSKREFEEYKRKYLSYGAEFTSINVSVRSGGTPHFIVPGNCACLGANPDEFKNGGDIYSHNLDTSLQQMTMLASLISFWNGVLRPLYSATK